MLFSYFPHRPDRVSELRVFSQPVADAVRTNFRFQSKHPDWLDSGSGCSWLVILENRPESSKERFWSKFEARSP